MGAPRIGAIKSGTMVRVMWFDAWGDEHQSDERDWKDSMEVETLGFLVRDTEHLITTVAERFTEETTNQYRGATHIPRGIVQSIDVLEMEAK